MLRFLTVFVIWGSCLFVAALGGRADEPAAKGVTETKLDGAWRLVAYKPPGQDEYTKVPEGSDHTKLVAGGRFVWTGVKKGKVVRSAGGKCAVRDNEYTEQIEFVLDEQDEWMVGKTGSYKWKLDGNKWHHDGVVKGDKGEAKITEVWERVK